MDKVRFQAQERLDLVDANALQALVYEYLGEMIGGIMGNAGGALTALEYTPNAAGGVYTLELKSFQYYHSQPGPAASVTEPDGTVRSIPRKYTGQVVTFDPSDEGQTATVDWSAIRQTWVTNAQPTDQTGLNAKLAVHGGHKPGGSLLMPFLWARPYTVDTDTDSRREWSVASQTEVAVSIATRTRVRTAFKFQNDRPTVAASDANQNQWVAVGRCVAWDYTSGTTNANGANIPDAPYIVPIYVWDQSFSHGDYEQANNLETTGTKGGVGHGTARFSMDDGAANAAQHPGANVNAGVDLESTPFEHDGATISNLARGNWVPGSKTGEPTIAGGAGTTVGTAAAGADPWPYPGWYDDRTGQWQSLEDSGWRRQTPLWRLGIPHVMHMMRRQMASIMSSKGDRPWFAFPSGGGLLELKDEIDALRTYVDDEIANLPFVRNDTGGNVSLLGTGRIDTTGTSASFLGEGITIEKYIRTSPYQTTANHSTEGAHAVVCRVNPAILLSKRISSVQIQGDAFGVGYAQAPTEPSAGDPNKPQGLRDRLPMAWVTLGNENGDFTSYYFTIWMVSAVLYDQANAAGPVQMKVGIQVGHALGGQPAVDARLWGGLGLPPTPTVGLPGDEVETPFTDFSVSVDFAKQWYGYDTLLTMNVTVHGVDILKTADSPVGAS